jgi:hypothetical protein
VTFIILILFCPTCKVLDDTFFLNYLIVVPEFQLFQQDFLDFQDFQDFLSVGLPGLRGARVRESGETEASVPGRIMDN